MQHTLREGLKKHKHLVIDQTPLPSPGVWLNFSDFWKLYLPPLMLPNGPKHILYIVENDFWTY